LLMHVTSKYVFLNQNLAVPKLAIHISHSWDLFFFMWR
jgi:hypothetical protein